jgi:predicted amino acid-binding ACT domain protein
MMLVELPASADVAKIKHGLQIAMEEVALNVELQHHAIFRMTNEI